MITSNDHNIRIFWNVLNFIFSNSNTDFIHSAQGHRKEEIKGGNEVKILFVSTKYQTHVYN